MSNARRPAKTQSAAKASKTVKKKVETREPIQLQLAPCARTDFQTQAEDSLRA